MNRRTPALSLLVVLMAALGAACGGTDEPGTDASAATTTSGATSDTSTDDTAATGTSTGAVDPEDVAPADGEPIHIGTVVTDDAPISFGAAADTLRAWVAWVNDTGGIGGRPVELDVHDDQLDPNRAREVYGTLTGDDSVVAIVGSFAPLGITAALGDIEAAGMPLVPGSGLVAEEFDLPTAYMLVSEPADYGYQACAYAQSQGMTDAALVYLDSGAVSEIVDGYERCSAEAGGEVVLSEAVAMGAANLADTALRIIDADPDVIFLEIDAFTTAQLWAELDRQGAQIPSLGNPGIYEDVLRDHPGAAADGFTIQTSVLPPHLDDPAVLDVQEVVETYAPGTVLTPVAMSSWVGAELFREAVELVQAEGMDITRENLVAALDRTADFTAGGLTPPITYGPDDHVGGSSYWFFTLSDGAWGPIGELQEGAAS